MGLKISPLLIKGRIKKAEVIFNAPLWRMLYKNMWMLKFKERIISNNEVKEEA